MLDKINETFHDGENIAKSAMTLTIERSQDLGQNPVMAITVLKVICEIAIEDYREHFMEDHPLGAIERKIDMFAEIQKMVNVTIREEFEQTKARAKGGQ